MDIGMQVAGQFGLNWDRWLRALELGDRLGFHSVMRSDHYYTGQPRDSLEAFVSLAVAAHVTKNVRFGTLVAPVTFRHPVDVGRMAAQIDILSGGRFVLGLGSGWAAPEYETYGLAFPSTKERMDRLDEAIRLMRAMWSDGPANFDGRFYQLKDATSLPKPAAGRPPIMIGGGGERRTLRIVAEHADEWNAVSLTVDQYRHKTEVLEKHCQDVGRDPATIRRSVDIFAIIGPSQSIIEEATDEITGWFPSEAKTREELREAALQRGMIFASTDEIVDLVGRFHEVGADEIIFQHILFDKPDIPEYISADIMPQVANL